jgi:ParB-like chromosome segregation protein Spo0J
MGEKGIPVDVEKNKKAVKVGWVRLPLSWLVKAKWNYKTDDAAKAKKLVANIKRNGQVQNLIVRPIKGGKFEIANGNHRLDAFEELKYADAVCYNLGVVSEKTAQRVAIETNETSFDADPVKLGQVLEGMLEEFEKDELLETLPYEDTDFDALIAAGGFDPNDIEEPDDVPEDEDETPKGQMPIQHLFAIIGVKHLPTEQAERLAAKMKSAIEKAKIPKDEKWKVLDLIVVTPAKKK